MTRHTHANAEWPETVGYSGWEAIEAAQKRKFVVFSSWGEDGWDAGEWPLVFVGLRKLGHHSVTNHPSDEGSPVWETVYYVEGDLAFDRFTLRADAIARLDELVHAHWTAGRWPFEGYDGDFDEPRFRGPFSWHRLCIKKGEPNCAECRATGTVVA